MLTPEGKLKKQVKAYAKTLRNAWSYFPQDRFEIGIPDWILCYRGHFVVVELKSKRGRARTVQKITLRKIREAGGHAMVAKTLEEIKGYIAFIDETYGF